MAKFSKSLQEKAEWERKTSLNIFYKIKFKKLFKSILFKYKHMKKLKIKIKNNSEMSQLAIRCIVEDKTLYFFVLASS